MQKEIKPSSSNLQNSSTTLNDSTTSKPKEEAKSASDIEVNVPVVFYCKGCRNIVADSWALAQTSEPLNTISVVASENIFRAPEAVMSKEGLDMGCSYFPLHCGSCQAELGRVYISTSRTFDSFRDLYTFDVDNIGMYRLGMGSYLDGVAPVLPVGKPIQRQMDGQGGEEKGKEKVSDLSTRDEKSSEEGDVFVVDQVRKLRHVVQILHARLCMVERDCRQTSSLECMSNKERDEEALLRGRDFTEEDSRQHPTTRSIIGNSRMITRSSLRSQHKKIKAGDG